MRSISSNALAKLSQNLGTEPINIIEIQWVDGGERYSYADRDIEPGVQGKIYDLGELDDVVNIDGGGQSQKITVTMDDVDGSIKQIIDNYDIHKRPCWVYQWFQGLDLSDKFLIFRGQISSPIEWDEGARTVTFDVISQIEDVWFGFSAEEGFFFNMPQDLVGKAWPVVFGTCLNVPALKLKPAIHGTLATGTGVADAYGHSLNVQNIIGTGITEVTFTRPTVTTKVDITSVVIKNAVKCPNIFLGWQSSGTENAGFSGSTLNSIYGPDPQCVLGIQEQLAAEGFRYNQELGFQIADVVVFNGKLFPQGVSVKVNMGGGHFVGVFTGNNFHITGRSLPTDFSAWRSDTPYDVGEIVHFGGFTFEALARTTNVPPAAPRVGSVGTLAITFPLPGDGNWLCTGLAPAQGFFWASAGSDVFLESAQEIVYEANIMPSTVLRVAAFRNLDAGRQLIDVPPQYYTIRTTNFSTFSSTEIVLNREMSTLGLGWENDVFVSMTSPVGPNVADVLQWIIERYTEFTIDTGSFATARTQLDNYPAHFAVLDRKNVLQVLQEIAYQTRCALYLKDGVFFIKYLSMQPDIDDTIGVSDIMANSLKLFHSQTEDLITQYTASWVEDYSIDQPNFMVLRLNVSKYGTHRLDYNYYIYSIDTLARKSATFWLIRRANTWRKLSFSTALNKLNLEVFDCVGLNIPHLAPTTIRGIVEKASYNSATNQIDFVVWTPLKSGTTVPYDFAFPAGVAEQEIFPTVIERQIGLAGSGTSPNFLSFPPAGHVLSHPQSNLFQSIGVDQCTNFDYLANADFPPCRPDHGDPRPSDQGDTKPSPQVPTGGSGSINAGPAPVGKQDCCDAAAKAQQTAQQAQQTAQAAQDAATQAQKTADAAAAAAAGGDGSANNNDKLNRLPKKPKDPTCTVDVTVNTIVISEVSLSPADAASQGHVLSTDPGQQGRPAVSTPGETKTYNYNSLTAARAFADATTQSINAKFDSYGFSVGETADFTVNVGGSLGNDSSGQPCAEPPSSKQALVAFDPGK